MDSVDFKANQIEYIYWLSWFCLQSYKKYYKSQSAEQPQDANHPMLLGKKMRMYQITNFHYQTVIVSYLELFAEQTTNLVWVVFMNDS